MLRSSGARASRLDWSAAVNQLAKQLTQTDVDRFRALFRALDVANRGEIDVDVLEVKLTKLGLTTAREELGDLLHDIDVDGNGKVDFDEFVVLMQTLTSTGGDQDSAAMSVPGPCFRGPSGDDLTWRELLWATLESPSTSKCASWTGLFLTVCICLSIVAFILETVSDLEVMSDAFSVIEVAVTAVFTAEIVARLMSCPSPRAYCTILNIVDVIAVLPLYLEAAVQGDARATDSLKIMRILRLFRIFKLSRYFSAIKLIVGALTLSAVPLMMALFLTLLGTVLFASAMYYIERGAWDAQREIYIHQASGAPSDFQSILDAMWWTTIALATVGYGDVGPRTGEGKALGVVVALSGVVILAFPISIFAANFSELYVLTQRRAALQKELSSDLLAGLSRIAADRDDVQADGIPRFNNPHLPTPTPSSKGSGVFFSAGAADDAPGEPWRQQPQGKEHFEAAAAAQAAPRGLETMRRLQKIASTHFVTLADTEVDANTAAEVFGLHPASAQPAMPRVGKARQRSASDAKQAGQLMTPYGWSHSVVSNSHEAQSLVEAVAIARAARRYQVMEVGEEDSRMVRGSSFAHLNLTDDEILRASVSKLCRDARKRIWLKIRRREQKMHDAVAIELARRWRSWFDVDAETVIGVTEVMVDDKALLRKEASVLSLAELEPGSVGPSPSANSADEHVESSQRDRTGWQLAD